MMKRIAVALVLSGWMVGSAQAAPDVWHIRIAETIATTPDASETTAPDAQDERAASPSIVETTAPDAGHLKMGFLPQESGATMPQADAGAHEPSDQAGSRTLAEAALPPAELTDAQARGLLDYKLYDRVEAGMRARLKLHPFDGPAWLLLADSLQAQGRNEEAAEARRQGRQYGSGERSWHVAFRLGGLVDSNVVIAPDAIHFAPQDKGDIGGRIVLSAYGRLLERDWGYSTWQLGYSDMLYQDFNTFAVRKLQAAAAEHLIWGEDTDISLGLQGEQASLGGKSFYAGWQATSGFGMPLGQSTQLQIDGAYGRRNFAIAFADYSAWRWNISPHVEWHGDGAEAGLDASLAREQTKLGVESYRQLAGGLSGGWRALDLGESGEFWLRGQAGLAMRTYSALDSRPFLRLPLQRKDTELKLIGAIEWQRPTALWGSGIGETWQAQAGWMHNKSNMDALAVFDPAQSRDWRRWWSEVSVQWVY